MKENAQENQLHLSIVLQEAKRERVVVAYTVCKKRGGLRRGVEGRERWR